MKLRPKIAQHDYETKRSHVRRFLDNGDKVKVTIMFRGRETTHPERGEQLLMRLAEDVEDLGTIEQRPSLDGRNMTMVMNPLKAKERKPEPDKKRRASGASRLPGGSPRARSPRSLPRTGSPRRLPSRRPRTRGPSRRPTAASGAARSSSEPDA